MSQHQKVKTKLDLLEQEIVSGSGISWAIYKSAPLSFNCYSEQVMRESVDELTWIGDFWCHDQRPYDKQSTVR